MIQVINNQIKQHGLPKTGILLTGETVINYHLLDEETLKNEGWLPLEESKPEYNTETEWLRPNGFEILEDKVIKHYVAEPIQKTKVELLEERLLSPIEIYERLNISSTPLEQLKHHKLNQLNEQCGKAIVSGFTYEVDNTTYLFSASLEAQNNFQGTNAFFNEGVINDVYWSATNVETGIVERIRLDKATFDIIKITVFSHVNSQISKFRDTLQPLVLNATTVEEVDSIVW